MIALGLAWTLVWPINKPLWSGSYVLVSSGLAAVTLATLVYVVDARGIRQWGRPFLWLGVNPLAIYFCSELVGHLMERPVLATALSPKDSIYWRALVPLTGNRAGEWTSLLFAIGFVCCWIWASAILLPTWHTHRRLRSLGASQRRKTGRRSPMHASRPCRSINSLTSKYFK